MDPVMQISNAVQQNLDSILGVPFMSSAVTLGLAFYAYKAAPELPSFVEELFLNVFFQVFIGFMVLFMTTQNVMLSFIVSAVFIYGMRMLSNVKEGMYGGRNLTTKYQIIGSLNDLTDSVNKLRDDGYSTKANEVQASLNRIKDAINAHTISENDASYKLSKLKEEVQEFAMNNSIESITKKFQQKSAPHSYSPPSFW